MERRKFLRGAGILGSVLGGVAAGKMVVEKHYHETKYIAAPEQPKEEILHLAPESPPTLSLQGGIKKQEPSRVGNEYSFAPYNVEYENQVDMAVGKDNRLWIKVGEEWKRVVVEG